MTLSDKAVRVAIRRSLTGEDPSMASRHLAQLPRFGPVVPVAAPAQAEIEADVFRECGYTSYEPWDPVLELEEIPAHRAAANYPPFGLCSVTPTADGLRTLLHSDMLAQWIGVVLPVCDVNSGELERGVPGLRARVDDRHTLLTRLGAGGQIRLEATRAQWDRACAVALANSGEGLRPWLRFPDTWAPGERQAAARRQRYAAKHQGRTQVLSALLRRPHLFKGFTDYCHLWADGAIINIEWKAGPTHPQLLQRLLDPVHGIPGLALDTRGPSCRCDDPDKIESCYWQQVTAPDGTIIHLRRRDPQEWELYKAHAFWNTTT